MRRDEVRSLVGYMYWANHRLLDAARGLSDTEFASTSGTTTRDLRATLVHELDVEWSWRLRLQGRPIEEYGPDVELQPADYPSLDPLLERWRADESDMLAWLDGLTDDALMGPVASLPTRHRRPLWQFILHIVIHACQQQADIATLLSAIGRSPGELGYLEYLGSAERPAEPSEG